MKFANLLKKHCDYCATKIKRHDQIVVVLLGELRGKKKDKTMVQRLFRIEDKLIFHVECFAPAVKMGKDDVECEDEECHPEVEKYKLPNNIELPYWG